MGGDTFDWLPVVAIPARNEADRLPNLLEALGEQSWLARSERRLHVILVINNSSDGSATIAAMAAARHAQIVLDLIEVEMPQGKAHVGTARRLAMDRALRVASKPFRSVLLTTDADATPMPTWIETNLQAIDEGADLVGGHVLGDEAEEAMLGPLFLQHAARQARYARLVDHLSTMVDPLSYDAWPRHSDHTGASLAVRADVYRAVGGIPALPFREDLAFASRVRGAGYRLRHSLDVRVRVSARLEGRAPGGMADCIKGWVKAENEGLPHLVEDPKSVYARLQRRRMCRDMRPAERIEFFEEARHHALGRQRHHGSLTTPRLIELVAADEPDAVSDIPIETAIDRLEQMIAVATGAGRVG